MSDLNNPGSIDNTRQTITGTFFFHKQSRHKQEFELAPEALVNLIQTHHKERKEDLQWIKLAHFGNHRTGKDALRNNQNVIDITGVEADYDEGEIFFEEAITRIREAGIAALAYTSPSHKPDKPRWRILAPLSRKHAPDERAQMLARLNGLFNGALGQESFTLSQSYYFGYVGNGAAPPASHRAVWIKGKFIDTAEELDADAVGKHRARKTGGGEDGERFDFQGAVRELTRGGGFHVPLRSLVASMAGKGMMRDVVAQIARGLFDAARERRPDLEGREREIGEIISWVYQQEEGKQVRPTIPAAPQPERTAKPAEQLPPDISIDDFYAYLPKHQYLYVPTQTLWPPATISSRLGKQQGMKPTRWLDKHKAVSQQVWAPGAPQIVHDKHLIEGGWFPKPGAIIFNQYREPLPQLGDPAEVDPWLDLVKFLYPDPMEHEHLIKVLAFKVQNPATKIMHAIVLGGDTRIGKDTILVPIRRIFGSWNCKEAKPSDIMGLYNPYMKSVVLVVNETHDLGEIKKYHFYDHMKTVIATPPDVVSLNDKYEKATQILNICLVIMTTNYRTDGLYLPPGDARHFPIWSTVQKEDFEIDFFVKHYAWLDNGGVGHVAAYLHSLDVSDFNPGQHPPITTMFRDIVDAQRPHETSIIEDILDAWAAAAGSQRPPVFVLSSIVRRADDEFKKWLTNSANRKSIPYRLEECGYTKIPNPRVADGRWTVGGIKQNVYGDKNLDAQTRLDMAQELR